MKSSVSPILRQAAVIPPVIRKEAAGKELTLFRIKDEHGDSYELEHDSQVVFTFSHWQFHVLNALFSYGGDNYEKLLVGVNDRFGTSLAQGDIEALFASLQSNELFDTEQAAKHPLTATFCQGGHTPRTAKKNAAEPKKETESSTAKPASFIARIGQSFRGFFITKDDDTVSEEDDPSQDAADEHLKLKHLFNPTDFLNRNRRLFSHGKYLLYALPVFLAFALITLVSHQVDSGKDYVSHFGRVGIMGHFIFGFLIINTASTFAQAAVAHAYTASVKSISLMWLFGFIPRFIARIEDVQKLSRREKLWLFATPILVRLGLFSTGVFLWFHNRHLGGVLPEFGATLAYVSGFSTLIVACPFFRSSGYRFLTLLLNEPLLRHKATKAFLSYWHGDSYAPENRNAFITYALANALFVIALAYAIIAVLYSHLEVSIGSKGVIVAGLVASGIGYTFWSKLRALNEHYHKIRQFERWRDRTILTQQEESSEPDKTLHQRSLKKIAWVSGMLFLFFPYPYQPSGQVVLLPKTQQYLTTDIAGVIGEVYYDGGETLKKGTVIASLMVGDDQAQLAFYKGKLAEQQAIINSLKAQPIPVDLQLAQEALNIATTRYTFSQQKCDRQQKLYKSGAISLEAMAEVEQVCQVDMQRKMEAEAELAKVKSGTPPEEMKAAEASLLPIQAQVKLYEDKITRSRFVMPFDGKLASLNLKDTIGTFLDRGKPFALVENDTGFKAVLAVPETEVAHVSEGAIVTLRTKAYPDENFRGRVKTVSADIEDSEYGKMMNIIVELEEGHEVLKSGMTGYAKVSGDPLAVWQVLTRAIYRFITVEAWAWLP